MQEHTTKPSAIPSGWTPWHLCRSSDRTALSIVDGLGRWQGMGPHYSRRTPGSKTFTGVGREIVLVTNDASAVWASVLQKTPAKRGSGSSRGRLGEEDQACRWIWRNMMFRNLGSRLSSELIRWAVVDTYELWRERYGELPSVPLRTEISIRDVKSRNPGYCYIMAGWRNRRIVRGKVYLDAPTPREVL